MNKELKEIIPETSYLKVDYWMTHRCDQDCFGCYGATKPLGKEMNLEQIKSVFTKLTEIGVRIVTLTGGEPLVKEENTSLRE